MCPTPEGCLGFFGHAAAPFGFKVIFKHPLFEPFYSLNSPWHVIPHLLRGSLTHQSLCSPLSRDRQPQASHKPAQSIGALLDKIVEKACGQFTIYDPRAEAAANPLPFGTA